MKTTEEESKAWELYCEDTKGCFNTKDFWWELSAEVQQIYMERLAQETH